MTKKTVRTGILALPAAYRELLAKPGEEKVVLTHSNMRTGKTFLNTVRTYIYKHPCVYSIVDEKHGN
jgi:hypothetical protein